MKKRRATATNGAQEYSASHPPSRNNKNSGHSAAAAGPYGDIALWAAIFCATLLAYLPALNGSPVWDDSNHLTRTDLQSLHGLWRIWFDLGATQQYYPLLHSAFWFEHRIFGNAVIGYHLINVLLHAFSACLIVLIARRLSLSGAWLAGFVFALHPVCVESVAWISEQKSTLSGAFCLSALLAYLYFDQSRRRSTYYLATGLFLLALMSKSVTALLPVLILVVIWWRRKRVNWKSDGVPLIPWVAIGMIAGLFTAWVERTYIGANGSDFLLTPLQRILIAGRVLFFYAAKLVWPVDLAFFYPHWHIDTTVWWQWLFPGGILAIAIGLVLAARHRRGPLASFLIFSGTLFPVLGFLNVYPFRYSYVADHFQYLACLGIIVPGISVLTGKLSQLPSGKNATRVISILLIGVLGSLTWRHSAMYRDIETLYRKSLEHNPDSLVAHYNLGTLLAEKPDQLDEAIEQFQEALKISPDNPEVLNNIGIVYSRTPGRLQDAIAAYQAALRVKPDYAEAHNNLGKALARIAGQEENAIAEYRAAIKIQKDFADAHYNLGNLLARNPSRQDEAISEYEAALKINPDFAFCHYNLGNLLSRIPNRSRDAIAEYRLALKTKPDFAEAHNNLGMLLAQIPGQLPNAIDHYETAIKIVPGLADAHFNLGIALAQMPGRSQEAITELQTAAEIRPEYAIPVSQRIKYINAAAARTSN